MSYREIVATVRAVNRASSQFSRIQTDAESLAARIRSIGAAIAGLGATGGAIGSVAHQMGLLNDTQAKVFNSGMAIVSAMGMFMRTSLGVAVARKLYTAATWASTAAENALNISHATFIALAGVGIPVIIALSSRLMWDYASRLNFANASVQGFNAATSEMISEMPRIDRRIRRALFVRMSERLGDYLPAPIIRTD